MNNIDNQLKAGNDISVMKNGESIQGRVDVLTRMAVRVSITYPIGCSASRYADQARFAERVDGVCIGNDEGVSVARELLVKLHEQAVYLMEHKREMGLFICEYFAFKEYKTDRLRVLTMKEIEEYKQLKDELDNLLPTMREHYFPTITDLEMDEAFLKRYTGRVFSPLPYYEHHKRTAGKVLNDNDYFHARQAVEAMKRKAEFIAAHKDEFPGFLDEYHKEYDKMSATVQEARLLTRKARDEADWHAQPELFRKHMELEKKLDSLYHDMYVAHFGKEAIYLWEKEVKNG